MDDMELVADPMSIVRSTNKISEEAVEEAQGRGEETHRRIRASLEQINEWESKLATLGNVAHRNTLPKMSLLELDEVITCENVLAKTRQALEDSDAPLVSSNRQFESSSYNIKTLLDSAGLPQIAKSDNSFPSEVELDATLGEFTAQFTRQLASVDILSAPQANLIAAIPPIRGHKFGGALYRDCEVESSTMEHREEKSSPEGSQGVKHSPTHVARWEEYLMAKEMTRSLETNNSSLDKSVKAMQEELKQVKDATQGLSTTTIHVMHELSHIHHQLSPNAQRHPPEDEACSLRPTPKKPNGKSSMHGLGDHRG
eukprot:Gb_12614 [translate_table: standard]